MTWQKKIFLNLALFYSSSLQNKTFHKPPSNHCAVLAPIYKNSCLWNFCSSRSTQPPLHSSVAMARRTLGGGGAELLHNRENNIFLLYPLSPTLIHHSLTQHVHHGHHAALANNWGSSETLIQVPFLPLCRALSKESNPSVYVQYIR